MKEERTRLGLSQTELGGKAGIQRLAQSQYEAETRFPTTRYLADIAEAGVDLSYLFFGAMDEAEAGLPATEMRRVEQESFTLVEDYVNSQCNGQMSAEGRFVLFELIRSQLKRAVITGQAPVLDLVQLITPKAR